MWYPMGEEIMNLSTCRPGGRLRSDDRIAVVWMRRHGCPVTSDFHEYGSAIRLPVWAGVNSFGTISVLNNLVSALNKVVFSF